MFDSLPVQLIAALLLALAGITLGLWLAAARTSARQSARNDRAMEGERDAETLLASHGWTVVARQVRATWTVFVDNEPVPIGVRADFIVERKRVRRVAEVKSGRLVGDVQHGATRRQLLEYQAVFGGDAVMLVDTIEGNVHEVRFPDETGSLKVARSAPR